MSVVKYDLLFDRQLLCALVTNLKNADKFRQLLIEGQVLCTVVKPSLIVDIFQICVAANKAVLAELQGKLTTKSVYTEILFNLSVSKNISQSLLKFGIDNNDTEILVVSLNNDAEMTNILNKIDGDVVDISLLSKYTKEKAIRKVYKISDNELSVSSLIGAVVSKIATKDFVNF